MVRFFFGYRPRIAGCISGENVRRAVLSCRSDCGVFDWFVDRGSFQTYILSFYVSNAATAAFIFVTDFSNRFFDSGESVSSTIFSTPSFPRMTGTPME